MISAESEIDEMTTVWKEKKVSESPKLKSNG